MLSIPGRPARFCDRIHRRDFLRIGSLAFGAGALSLADVYRAEARAGSSSPHKAVINVFLAGGPAHLDTFDLKPDAPAEIRGEFRPIATKVPGLHVSEIFPKLAARMDKVAVIRSVVGSTGRHDAFQCLTGWDHQSLSSVGGRPSFGAVASRLQGPVDPSVPSFVGLAARTEHVPWSDAGKPGFLGTAFAPFKPEGDGLADMKLTSVNRDNLADRKTLLSSFDRLRRDIDSRGSLAGVDAAQERALNVLTSSRLLEALDLEREDPKVRSAYGDGRPYQYQYDGAPTVNDQLLLARRLVEAGVRVVTLSYGRWDSHANNFELHRDHGGKLDQALSALIDDLTLRGMLDDVTVIAWGEFGRTPRINAQAGRDHWPQVSCAVLAGGGLKTGQAVGATNRLGEYAVSRPVHFQEIAATLYHALGLNPATATIADPTGRPQHLVESPPLPELVG
jgi:hypothetical protein